MSHDSLPEFLRDGQTTRGQCPGKLTEIDPASRTSIHAVI